MEVANSCPQKGTNLGLQTNKYGGKQALIAHFLVIFNLLVLGKIKEAVMFIYYTAHSLTSHIKMLAIIEVFFCSMYLYLCSYLTVAVILF